MTEYAALLVVAASLALAVVPLARPPRRLAQIAFATGMLGLGLEAAGIYALLSQSDTAETHRFWLAELKGVGLLLPAPWCLFAFVSARRPGAPIPMAWRLSFAAGGAGLVLTALAGAVWPFVTVSVIDGPFLLAHLTRLGEAALAVEILATVAVLYGLEPSIRNSYGSTRWRMKYLALGLVGIFAARFYLLSQALLFRLVTPESLRIEIVTVAIGLVFVAYGLFRTGALRADLSVSRHFVYRSIVVAIAGAYLFLAGAAGWLMNTLGIPDKVFWGTLVLFVSVMALGALVLSESLRWRVKRYVSTHFYAEKYDYRQQWRSFTGSLATCVTLDSLLARVLRSVTDTIGTTRAALYLAEEATGTLRLASATGTGRLPPAVAVEWADFVTRQAQPEAVSVAALGNGRGQALLAAGLVVAVPLLSQRRLFGVMLIGAERTETAYAQEDLDLLTTLGEQAASAIATAQLSDRLAQSRAFEAFHRLTSFVVHDLKNSTAALSLLTQNAKEHFDDPEFRRDALRTLGRTVERMQKLLGRLSSRQVADALEFDRVDLGALSRETAESVLAGSRVRLALEIEPAPPVRGDADALGRVIQNLITNAVEAMDGEGAITIRTSRREGLVACSVADTGCGMSEEFIRKSLFVPFQTTKKGGWGVGLYQARETVQAHAGRIEVASREGHGTTITLLIPEAPR